jgi:hypothetical protein
MKTHAKHIMTMKTTATLTAALLCALSPNRTSAGKTYSLTFPNGKNEKQKP